MKKFLLSLAAIASLTALAGFNPAQAQADKPAAGAAAAPGNAQSPVKVGLVDMAKVFKKYEKFARLREDLQGQMTQMQAEAKAIKGQVEKLAEEMKGFNKDSKEYRALQEKIVRMTSDFDTKAKISAPDFARKEAQIFEDVYLEVSDVITKYAEFYKYTLVLRFNSDQIDADSPQQLANGLNKLVLYHRPQDDITEPVIEFLNRQFNKNGKPATAAPAKDRTASEKPTPRN